MRNCSVVSSGTYQSLIIYSSTVTAGDFPVGHKLARFYIKGGAVGGKSFVVHLNLCSTFC